jgi:hypothetical protein
MDIRVRFLIDATPLTLAGDLIGTATGGLITFLVRTLIPSTPAVLSLLRIVLGVGGESGPHRMSALRMVGQAVSLRGVGNPAINP